MNPPGLIARYCAQRAAAAGIIATEPARVGYIDDPTLSDVEVRQPAP